MEDSRVRRNGPCPECKERDPIEKMPLRQGYRSPPRVTGSCFCSQWLREHVKGTEEVAPV